ncbi:MAG: hypothetical protein A2Y38_01310, partial [Spirochaetes bacterium GWB1_59_5]
EDLKWDLKISHPAVSDPTDYKGMPCVIPAESSSSSSSSSSSMRAEFLPFGDLNYLINATKPTVAFIDDIGQSPPAVQAALMQLILARRVNGHRISDKVVFCGATNDTNHMAGVSGLLEPVKSRFSTIIELEVSLDDWCHWALDNDMPPELIAFIRFRPALLSNFKPTRELKNSPCPRTVAAVGHWLNAGIKDLEVFAGAAGEGFATEFIAFLGMYAQLPNLDDVIMNPTTAPVPENPASCYAVISGLARKCTVSNCERVFTYIKRLEKEFEVCCVRDIVRIEKKVTATPTFVTWAIRNGDVLS